MSDNLTTFNPETSAALMKLRIKSYARITSEIVAELYRAKDFYSAQGSRSDLLPDGSKLNSFKAYLEDIGLYESKAYRWLERYVPEENKLLTYEEFSEKKEAERLAKMSAEERERSMIAEFRKTGIRPPGWTPKLDKAVKDTDAHLAKVKEQRAQEEAERLQRAKEAKEKHEAFVNPPHSRPDAPPPDDADYYYRLGKSTEEMLKSASTTLHTKHTERQNWKEKIRLSDGGKEDAFMDAIIDYMETLSDDNRRIEACNNIIKICRNISVELQKKNTVK